MKINDGILFTEDNNIIFYDGTNKSTLNSPDMPSQIKRITHDERYLIFEEDNLVCNTLKIYSFEANEIKTIDTNINYVEAVLYHNSENDFRIIYSKSSNCKPHSGLNCNIYCYYQRSHHSSILVKNILDTQTKFFMCDETTLRFMYFQQETDEYGIGTIGVYENDNIILELNDVYSDFKLFEDKSHDFIIQFYREPYNKKVECFATRNGEIPVDYSLLHHAESVPRWDDKIHFFVNSSKAFYIIKEIAQKAEKYIKIENSFADDISENYYVVFSKNQQKEKTYMKYIVNSCWGMQIYEYSILDILYKCSHFGSTPNNDNNVALHWYRSEEHARLIDAINNVNLYWRVRSIYSTNIGAGGIEYNTLDEIMKLFNFKSQSELFYYIYETYFIFLEQEISALCNPNINFDRSLVKEELDLLYSNLINEDKIPLKWKSEADMFKVIKAMFNDAIFHFTSKWLGLQHIDVFVPSINTAFEYQGQQHFHSVQYFGGDEALQRRIELDTQKREKCRENNIRLIDWNYDEEITKKKLLEKIKQ